MPDVYHDTYTDTYGTLGPAPGAIFSLDGTNAPRLIVEVAFGGSSTVDPQQGYFILGGPGVSNASQLGTGVLGSIGWVDVAADADSVSIKRGSAGEQESATPATCTVVLDNASGDYDPTNTAGPYYGQIDVGQPVWVKAEWQGTIYSRFRGFIDDILPNIGQDVSTVTLACTDAIASLGRTYLAERTAEGAGETTGARVNRILDAAAHPTSQRIVATGLSKCQATTFGDYAPALLQKAVGTELGALYTATSGEIVFRDRLYPYTSARSSTVRALLTDTGTDVDMVTLEVGMRRSKIWNSASLTPDGGTTQTVTDAASAAKYGTQSYPSSAGEWLQTDADATSLASWIVGWGKNSRLEVTSVSVQAATLGLWDTMLKLDILDRIRAVRDYGPVTVDAQVLVESYEESISKDAWDFTFSTRAADAFQPFVLNTSKLNTGTLA